jgi:peptide-methionine (S)-S-oxide reductase
MLGWFKKQRIPSPAEALPGRAAAVPVPTAHHVNGNPLAGPYPDGLEEAMFGMGCFWGAERKFWQLDGVYSTAVGYSAGHTPNPSYREVCSGMTGHNEVVKVVYAPEQITYEALLRIFFEGHNPTQGMRQGNDAGTQYRSGVYCYGEKQHEAAKAAKAQYGRALKRAGHAAVTTEVRAAEPFYFAEDYHQQYLAKNPAGYCGLGGTGVSCPIGTGVDSDSD